MKIGLSEDTARKALAHLPADGTDQDIRQLRDRLEQGLKAATGSGMLTRDELATLRQLVCQTIDRDGQQRYGGPGHLQRVLAKLEALLDRGQAAAEGRG